LYDVLFVGRRQEKVSRPRRCWFSRRWCPRGDSFGVNLHVLARARTEPPANQASLGERRWHPGSPSADPVRPAAVGRRHRRGRPALAVLLRQAKQSRARPEFLQGAISREPRRRAVVVGP